MHEARLFHTRSCCNFDSIYLRDFVMLTTPEHSTSLCARTDKIIVGVSSSISRLDQLLEGAVDRRAERLDILVELDRGNGTFGDAIWLELEFLQQQSVSSSY